MQQSSKGAVKEVNVVPEVTEWEMMFDRIDPNLFVRKKSMV